MNKKYSDHGLKNPSKLKKDNSYQLLEEIMEINNRVESDIGDFIKKTK